MLACMVPGGIGGNHAGLYTHEPIHSKFLTSKTVSTGVGPSTEAHPLSTAATCVVPSTIVLCHTVNGTVTAIEVGRALHPKAEPDPAAVISRVPLHLCEGGTGAQAAVHIDVVYTAVQIERVFIEHLNVQLKGALHAEQQNCAIIHDTIIFFSMQGDFSFYANSQARRRHRTSWGLEHRR